MKRAPRLPRRFGRSSGPEDPADGGDATDRPYEVGYARPPREHRFKTGQSGNRRGRPKGSKNLRTIVLEVLDQKLEVKIDGKTKKVTVREAVVQKIATDSLRGDARARQLILELMKMFAPDEENSPSSDAPLAKDDQAILADFLRRKKEESEATREPETKERTSPTAEQPVPSPDDEKDES